MLVRRAILLSALALVAGCSVVAGVQDLEYADPIPSTHTSSTDPSQGGAADGGSTSADGATFDASSIDPLDAGEDGADAEVDAGEEEEEEDTGPLALGACTPADFLANDRRGPNKPRLITFPVGAPAQYTPRCMIVRVGQPVTWQGDFAVDPLEARSQNPPSPITLTAAGNSATFTFVNKGRYRYGSTAKMGLRGAIDVRP